MPETAAAFIHQYVAAKGANPYTLLLLHGTGGDEHDLIPLGESLAPGAGILSPRGKSPENGMNRFFRRTAMGIFDLEDLKFRTQELADFVAAAADQYGFNPRKVLAAGYSNGANIAASLLLLRPEVLTGAVLLRPMVPLIPDHPPTLNGVPVWIGGGRRDPIIRPELTGELAKMLEHAGAQVELHWSPGGHELNPTELTHAREWMGRSFGPAPRNRP